MPDDDWLGTGISETLSADLAGLEGVTVVPRVRLHELLRTLAQETGETDERLRLRAARTLGARWLLAGSFQRAGDAVRVTASLVDATTSLAARTMRVDGRLDEIFALQDRLVLDLADALRAVIKPAALPAQETSVVAATRRTREASSISAPRRTSRWIARSCSSSGPSALDPAVRAGAHRARRGVFDQGRLPGDGRPASARGSEPAARDRSSPRGRPGLA